MIGSEKDWTVITVTYNNGPTLERCWSELDASTVRWIVVDNGSKDGSPEIAKDLGADVISLDVNLGFSKANNIGLKNVSSAYTAFVNPDVVLRPEDLPSLGHLSSEHKALVSPQLINMDQTLQPNARGLPFLTDKFAHRGLKVPGADIHRYIPVMSTNSYAAWLIGAVIIGETEVFRSLGGWDERFFLYHEDSSLCLSAWEQGYSVIVSTDHRWVHEWKRDSKSLRWHPILREAVSAWKFYRRYPMLLAPNAGLLPSPLQRARDLTGSPIDAGRRHEANPEGV